ncbi:hypothetical protein CC1G_12698 [Coprinopsis cinerea okayama7|uniref:Uncharacterized protein n=1 Tax=Coprinopsis cinerea (strain Okayama-7 / 130 / ATCC MYA-4618 / FGSC 9003) TaxID=240176 RepID=A8NAZ4_COPC7|nr:hypothetical protein CC1G_12698 [Coprinopsis cinerea okayama7\|eukprot:XP_001831996.2 hypothetical protein CC1G_12698 [Coprinopsis cinerea okayama7\
MLAAGSSAMEVEVPDDLRFVPFDYDIDEGTTLLQEEGGEEVWRTFSTQEAEGPPPSQSSASVPAQHVKGADGTAQPEGTGTLKADKGKQREGWAPFADEAAAIAWFSTLPEDNAASLMRAYLANTVAMSGPPHREAFPKDSKFPLATALKSAREASAQQSGASANKEMEEILKGVVDSMPENIRQEILSDDSELIWNIPSLESAGMSADLIDAQLNYMSSWLATLVNHYMHNCEVHERLENHLRAVKAALVLREQSTALSDSLKGLCNMYDS